MVTTIHSIQQREGSQAYTRRSMCPGDTNGKINGPYIMVKCKIDTGAGANIMSLYVFGKLCPAMFDSSDKALKKLDADWITLTAYGGRKMRQLGVRIIKCFWNNQKWKFLFHIVDATGPTLLGLKTLRHMEIFVKHPMVHIVTIDIHFIIQHRLPSQQIKKGEDGENQSEYQVASEVLKVGETCQTPAEESQVSIDMIYQSQATSDYISEGLEPDYDVKGQWYYMDELNQLAIHEIWNSPADLKAHPDYISAETGYHLQPPILNKEQLRHMYPECFYGIGEFKDYEYHITLEDNAKPVIQPPRKTPLALQPKLDKELDEMVEQGIIIPVNGPSAWINVLVPHKSPLVD